MHVIIGHALPFMQKLYIPIILNVSGDRELLDDYMFTIAVVGTAPAWIQIMLPACSSESCLCVIT